MIATLRVDSLAPGWFCTLCGAFNGDLKEIKDLCRCCHTERPTEISNESKLRKISRLVNESSNRTLHGLVTNIKEILSS